MKTHAPADHIQADQAQDLPAGDFSSWVRHTQRTTTEGEDADVPCGTCTACCTSSYFIPIRPDETETLSHIPEELLIPAPGRPAGHMLLGFDDKGHCFMLIDNKCTIYAHRPRTCRAFDCRVFTATGMTTTDEKKALIAERVARWRFSYPTPHDRKAQAAIKKAARFLREHADAFPVGFVPDASNHLVVLAIKVHHVFLPLVDSTKTSDEAPSNTQIAFAIMQALTQAPQ